MRIGKTFHTIQESSMYTCWDKQSSSGVLLSPRYYFSSCSVWTDGMVKAFDVVHLVALYTHQASFNFAQIVEALCSIPAPDLALRLYLQCAEVSNHSVLIMRVLSRSVSHYIGILSGCKWLWLGAGCVWIFYSGIYYIWGGNFCKFTATLGMIMISFPLGRYDFLTKLVTR